MQSASQGRRRKPSSNPIAAVHGLTKSDARSAPGLLRRLLAKYIKSAFALLFGTTVLMFFALRGFYDGVLVKRPSKTFWKDLKAERHRCYDLDVSFQHPSGLRHAFHTLNSGLKFHYLTSASVTRSTKTKHLVIFIHGFPDSATLWTKVINHLPSMKDCTIVSLDLPGFGGSDSPKTYGPNDIIQGVMEFCLAMRQQYLNEEEGASGKVIVTAFDWGGVIAFRLASEAPQIADRFIIVNAALPQAATRNVEERIKTAGSIFSLWRRTPSRYKILFKALDPLKPIWIQINRSGYVFAFNMPWILARQAVTRSNLWFVRLVQSVGLGYKTIVDSSEVTSGIAGFMGPIDLKYEPSPPDGQRYGASVVQRSQSTTSFADTIRYYREGLTTAPWKKDLDTILKLSALGDHNTKVRKLRASFGAMSHLDGALGAPVTFVFGTKDIALDTRIMLEGVEDYMTKGSQIVKLPVGHWVPLQGEGPLVLAAVVTWALGDETKEGLVAALEDGSWTAKVTMAK